MVAQWLIVELHCVAAARSRGAAQARDRGLNPSGRFPQFPQFPLPLFGSRETLVTETLVAGWVCPEKAMLPVLCSGVSAGIRHNIAQFCQELGVIAEQNNTCAPA
jgi:hypothetical protein